MYFEETDLCRRALDAGWEIWAVGTSVADHQSAANSKGSAVLMYSGCIAEHYFKSRYYYLVKHHGWLRAACVETLELATTALRMASDRLRRVESADKAARLRAPIFKMPDPPAEA